MMGLADRHWELLQYKLRYVGWRQTLRVAYLDACDSLYAHLARRFPSQAISPRSIQIECTTRCNLRCTMCELTYWTEKGGDLALHHLQAMVEHLPHLQRVDLTGIGEALMNRAFFEAVTWLKARGLYVTLNDNFTLMTERAARRLVDLGVDQIFLSLDGATRDTYEQIRVGANFDKVIANTQRLLRIKREARSKRPEVKINTVVSATNAHELSDMIDLAYELGIGMVQFVNIITFDNTAHLDTDDDERRVRDAFERAVERGRQRGVFVKVELFDKQPVEQCDFPWTRNFVTYDGHVHPCCFTTQTGDRQAQNQTSFGNLRQFPFDAIWQGERYQAFRRKMRHGILPVACRHCPKYVGQPDGEQPLEAIS